MKLQEVLVGYAFTAFVVIGMLVVLFSEVFSCLKGGDLDLVVDKFDMTKSN